jgi:AcrR family transcriptional regulator
MLFLGRTGRERMTSVERREEERVFDIACRLFMERGFTRITLAQIGSEAGVAEEALLTRYGDKKGLLFAALQAALATSLRELKVKFDAAQDEDLCRVTAAHFDEDPFLQLMRMGRSEQ